MNGVDMNRILIGFLAVGSLLPNTAPGRAGARTPLVHGDVTYATVEGKALAFRLRTIGG